MEHLLKYFIYTLLTILCTIYSLGIIVTYTFRKIKMNIARISQSRLSQQDQALVNTRLIT